MTYGALPLGGSAGTHRRGPGVSRMALAVAALTAGTLCVLAVVFSVTGRPAGAAELLFKTPKLKDLLGTFMKDQGAAAGDIREMDKYYKGASAKAPTEMLDDVSGEFDPITDADSNYGRVIGVRVAARTNPVVNEDMDVSPERKARVQMLWNADESPAEERELRSIRQHFSKKAPTQMLDDVSGEFDPITDADSNYGRVIGVRVAARTNPVVNEDMDVSPERKAPTEMLDDVSGEFDPITDTDSNYGRVIGVRVAARTNPVVNEDMDVSPERKAPTEMLDDVSGEFDPITDADSNYGRVIGVRVAARTNPVVNEDMDVSPERKAPTEMLDDVSGEFDPITDADSNYGRVIGVRVAARTNPVVNEDMDVSPERKARVQMLWNADESPAEERELRSIRQHFSKKAPTQMLYDVDGPQATDAPAASWKLAAKSDNTAQKAGNTLAAEIRAAWPK